MFLRKRKIPFNKLNIDVPIVRVRLENGVDGFAVIDTGSEMTVFDSNFVKRNRKCFEIGKQNAEIKTIDIKGDNNSMTFAVASAFVTFGYLEKNNDNSCVLRGIVSDLHPIIEHVHQTCGKQYDVVTVIGYDMLSKIKAVIDLNNQVMEMKV